MDGVETLEMVGTSWQVRTRAWDDILQCRNRPQAQLIFASLRAVADAPDMLRGRILSKFGVPPLLLSRVCLESNGFSGCEPVLDGEGNLARYNCWSRFVIKQTSEKLQPKHSFVRHPTGQKRHLKSALLSHLSLPIHGSESIRHGWEWYEMGFFVRWTPPSHTAILCFDLPRSFQIPVRSALISSGDEIEFSDPYAVFAVIICQLVSLYDNSVWSIRNHICHWEAGRQQAPDYPLLHEIARHATHVSETLAVAVESVKDLQQQHRDFKVVHTQSGNGWRKNQNPLQFPLRLLEGLLSRAESNKERIQNEILLAFHTAAQRDSKIQVQIAEETQKEAAAMKAIAVVTMMFLPATFISSVFSTPFFRFERAQDGGGDQFTVSSLFWVYWVLAVPLSLFALGLWVFCGRGKKQANSERTPGNSAPMIEAPV